MSAKDKHKEDLNYARENYDRGELLESKIDKDPVQQFSSWFAVAANSDVREANAMILASSNSKGQPSARVVLMRDFSNEGFVFYTNYNSRKGRDLIANPQAALLFFWDELERQIRIEGQVEKVSKEQSDAYFNNRPADSRAASISSNQSSTVDSRKELQENYDRVKESGDLSRPDHWGGFIVRPHRFEFWQGRPARLHDRIVYRLGEDGKWDIDRLAP